MHEHFYVLQAVLTHPMLHLVLVLLNAHILLFG